MSILGVILGVVGIFGGLLGSFAGLVGGVIGGVLGLAAVLLGFAARKKGKGVASIVVGALAIILSVVLTVGGINVAKDFAEKAKAHRDIAPTIARYIDEGKVNTNLGILGFIVKAAENKADSDAIAEELKTLQDSEKNGWKTEEKKEDPAPTAAPETETKPESGTES